MKINVFKVLFTIFICACLLFSNVVTLVSFAAEDREEIGMDFSWIQGGESLGSSDLVTNGRYSRWENSSNSGLDFPIYSDADRLKYVYHCASFGTQGIRSYTFTSGTEVVMYQEIGLHDANVIDKYTSYCGISKSTSDASIQSYVKKGVALGLVSKSQILYRYFGYSQHYLDDSKTNYEYVSSNSYYSASCVLESTLKDSDSKFARYGIEGFSAANVEYGLWYDNFKVFDTYDHAVEYVLNGTKTGLVSDPSVKTSYDKNVHFDSFNMDVHASNNLDNYYIDFRYQLPNSLLGKGYSLRIDSTYRREVSNVLTGDPYSSKEYTDYQYVTLSDNPFSCRVYLKNFNSVKLGLADKNKSTEPFYNYYGVLSYYDSVYLGLTSMADAAKVGYKVSMSLLNISCKLEKSGSRGFSYNGSLDILTGANDIGSYTPDSSGNYKPNNDYRQNGHYYTEVSTDSAENTTYNYYYITNDNSRTEISKDDNDNNTKSGEGIGGNSNSSASTSGNITNNNSPTFNNNNNITIEGDNINQEVNSYVDGKTSTDDNKSFIEKFLGFFELLENNSFLGVWGKVFGWLPPGISSVITTALGISAGIGIFRFFRR